MSQSLLDECVCACMHGRVGASVCECVCACMRICVCLRMCFCVCVCTWCGFCIVSYIYPTSSFHFCYVHKGKWHNLLHTCNDLGITWGGHPWETLVCLECPYELLGWLSRALGLWFGWVLLFIPVQPTMATGCQLSTSSIVNTVQVGVLDAARMWDMAKYTI